MSVFCWSHSFSYFQIHMIQSSRERKTLQTFDRFSKSIHECTLLGNETSSNTSSSISIIDSFRLFSHLTPSLILRLVRERTCLQSICLDTSNTSIVRFDLCWEFHHSSQVVLRVRERRPLDSIRVESSRTSMHQVVTSPDSQVLLQDKESITSERSHVRRFCFEDQDKLTFEDQDWAGPHDALFKAALTDDDDVVMEFVERLPQGVRVQVSGKISLYSHIKRTRTTTTHTHTHTTHRYRIRTSRYSHLVKPSWASTCFLRRRSICPNPCWVRCPVR